MRAREPFPGGAALGAVALCALLLPLPVAAQTYCSQVSADGLTTVEVQVLSPRDGALLARGPYGECDIPVAGIASAVGLPPRFDFFFVLDTSGSTSACAGTDVDGDTVVGQNDPVRLVCTDRGDTVLAAEVAGARAFLDALPLGENRAGVIGFSDPNWVGVTRTYQPLTEDRPAVEAALDAVLGAGSRGATDYAGPQDLLRQELLASGDPDHDWVGLFLSDGWPTFPVPPFDSSELGDWDAASDAADRLAAEGIRLFTFAVGTDAGDPVLRDMALRTDGRFHRVTNPGDLVDALPATVLVGLSVVVASNHTAGVTEQAVLSPGGEFALPLPGLRGWNDLEVDAYASDLDHTMTACPLRVYLSCAAGCQARTQGFWHRQCKATGEIASGASLPPLLVEEFHEMAEAVSGSLAFSGQTTCQALDADPSSDMCEKALKQYAALLLNMAWGILGPDCEADLAWLDPSYPATVGEAAALVEEWIREGSAGSCKKANDVADALNTGAALTGPTVVARVLPTLPPLSWAGPEGAEADRARPRPRR